MMKGDEKKGFIIHCIRKQRVEPHQHTTTTTTTRITTLQIIIITNNKLSLDAGSKTTHHTLYNTVIITITIHILSIILLPHQQSNENEFECIPNKNIHSRPIN